MSDPSSRSACVEVEAPIGSVFELVATPGQHHRFDASRSVGRAVTAHRLTGVGEVFTMQMSYRDGEHVHRYLTDNTVTRFTEPHCIEWAVAPHGEDPLGWRWRYEFEALDDQRTGVTLTYDWAGTPEENVRRFGVPLFDEAQLAASLALFARAAARGDG